MSRGVQILSRPEGGAEHGVVFHVHHNCKNAKEFKAALEDQDLDLLQFAVGLVGYTMPTGIPFMVTSSNPCGICGAQPSAWYEWKRELVIA